MVQRDHPLMHRPTEITLQKKVYKIDEFGCNIVIIVLKITVLAAQTKKIYNNNK